MHAELSGQPCLTSHIQEEVSKSTLPNITHTARKHSSFFLLLALAAATDGGVGCKSSHAAAAHQLPTVTPRIAEA